MHSIIWETLYWKVALNKIETLSEKVIIFHFFGKFNYFNEEVSKFQFDANMSLIPRMYLSYFTPHREKCKCSPPQPQIMQSSFVEIAGVSTSGVWQISHAVGGGWGVKITFIIPVSPLPGKYLIYLLNKAKTQSLW